MKLWIQTACGPAVMRRSGAVALVVGTLLVAINQGDRLVAGQGLDLAKKALLTYIVPYCVATYGAVSALVARGDLGGEA
ncbi:nitrate/nitrite transporter NrtS [Pelagibius litoralis]|uniref:Nitrate/nitrite transporter NrtS n=1 Tax=Pelagibius litoralis TaxID=374515 RepID=A0A967F3T5_9PROT|nr:nitrate/nitrite transporter NrtS [Pelagibius litoralis]NIA72469.1 nitrate/nitrite transporter NrtS [Pelagibius litoralis]